MNTPSQKETHPKPASQSGGSTPHEENNNKGVHIMSHNKTWQDNITRGRQLVGEINDRKWELGDLANEVCPAGAHGARDEGRLADFANEIGISAGTLRTYRLVAAAWAVAERSATQTWHTHKMLAAHPSREAIIAEQTWTYNSLSERLGRLPNPSRVVRETGEIPEPTDPAGTAIRSLQTALGSTDVFDKMVTSTEANRFVRDAIKADPQVAAAASAALDERFTDAAAARPIRSESKDDTNRNALDEATALIVKLRSAHRILTEAASLAQNIRGLGADDMRQGVAGEVEYIRSICDILEAAANGGPLDSQLQDLLDSEAGR